MVTFLLALGVVEGLLWESLGSKQSGQLGDILCHTYYSCMPRRIVLLDTGTVFRCCSPKRQHTQEQLTSMMSHRHHDVIFCFCFMILLSSASPTANLGAQTSYQSRQGGLADIAFTAAYKQTQKIGCDKRLRGKPSMSAAVVLIVVCDAAKFCCVLRCYFGIYWFIIIW